MDQMRRHSENSAGASYMCASQANTISMTTTTGGNKIVEYKVVWSKRGMYDRAFSLSSIP